MLRTPTELEVRDFLISSGIRFTDKGAYFSIACPFHSDKNPSASIYKDRWLFKCFGCNTTYSFSKLYETLKGKPWEEHGVFNMIPVPIKDTMPDDLRGVFAIEAGKVTSVYDNAKALQYCRDRGVSDDFMQFFNFQASDLCRFLTKKNEPKVVWKDRLLIPINLNDKPYSLEGRDYTRKQFAKCLYPKHCKTDICFNQDNLDKTKQLIVCEGVMDIHKIWSNINKNVTCTFGASLTKGQREYLKDCQNLTLFVDDDEAGHGSVSQFETFMNYDFKVTVVKGTDPGGATIDQIFEALNSSVSWVEFLIEEVKLFERSAKSSFSIKNS